jgi:hypothetical protein
MESYNFIIKPFPDYSYPTYLLLNLIMDILSGRRRSFRRDSIACISTLIPPLRICGKENIPSSGPCLITFNHYYRPGFNAWWNALAVAAQLPMETHIIVTGELTFPGKWFAPVGRPLSRWALKRIARIYGFTSMPPMPPCDKDVMARAQSVREVLSFVDRTKNPVISLAPEGGDMPGGRLAYPPLGAGRFMALLAKKGLKVIPVGVFEQDGSFCVHFGPAYELAIQHSFPSGQLDREVAKQIMENIAPLLPSQLRGEFL